MTRLLASIWLVMALCLAGCGSLPATSLNSGIQGMVQVGPTCPVERINSPCPPRPLATTVVVRNSQGNEVKRFHSAGDGSFKVDLAPGSYTLVGLPIGASFLPRPIPTTATVAGGTYTTVNVEYDSGIR
ncbi:MAG TPA: hypothetical protein VFR68_09635 [Candidatus Dormibacteraeota bacterium]|nr:hypothetical protein [Candidatus Dormibacteraeota bacterium]